MSLFRLAPKERAIADARKDRTGKMDKRPRILIVDDDPVMLKVYSRLFGSAGCVVFEASTGTECLKLAVEERPDLVLLDVVLPDMDGVEVSKAIRAIPELKDSFIVLVSGLKISPDNQAQGLECGADGYIVSPLPNRELLARVQAMLRIRDVQARLRASEERFRVLVENAPDAIFVENKGLFAYVNPTAVNLLGATSKDQLIRGPIIERFHPSCHETMKEQFRLLEEKKRKMIPSEQSVIGLDGTVIDVEVSAVPIAYDEVEGSLVFLRDISKRKEAEERLRTSEHFLRSILSSSPTLIYIYDLISRQNVFANQEIVDFLGYTQEQVLAMGPNLFLEILHPDDAAIVTDHHARFSNAPDDEVLEVEYRMKDSKGEWRWFHCQEALFARSPEGHAWRILGSAQDITERKHAEKERKALQAQLNQAQKMESVGRLAGGVAHDFNNSLGVVLGYTEMALEMTSPDQPIFADLKEIEKAARRSAELTRQLLAFARRQTISPKVLDLNNTVEGMLKMLRRLIGEDISLNWLPGNNLWPIKVDPSQIDQILANLCVNARDAITGTGAVTIETQNIVLDKAFRAEHEGGVSRECVLLAVRDDGSGMDRETMERVFEPFFTTKELGKGTGLGLATVYGIVKQNNGLIDACSEPGKGTAFHIYFPRYTAEVERVEPEDSGAPVTGSAETILLVEDEPANLKMAKRMLRRLGYTVLLAGAPGEAIRIAKEQPGKIRLLVTDVVMPEMNGRDLAENIMALNPDIKILFMSGYTADVIAHHGVLDEEVHFIQKPFSMQDLASKLQEMLGESEIE